jgi:hypothetical protein
MDLVFANQIANGGIGNQYLHHHNPAAPIGPRQQRLAEDAFQNQG